MSESGHIPVMVEEVVRYLALAPGKAIADCTIGCGGHALAIVSRLAPGGRLIGVDRDPQMIEIARRALGHVEDVEVQICQGNFAELGEALATCGLSRADGIFLDLGTCSLVLDTPSRGFSYRHDGPLLMQVNPGEGPTAEELVNSLAQGELARIFRQYGEERHAGRIARAIVQARRTARIRTTVQLAGIIGAATPGGRRRLHPARRAFQALRIACSSELQHLDRFLSHAHEWLAQGARLVLLSYHSLEDRRTKHALRSGARKGLYQVLTKKVVRPRADEVALNPRARSARLRCAVRL